MIDETQVKRVAQLARLSIDAQEAHRYAAQLDEILEYMEQLNRVPTEDVEPTAFVIPRHKPFLDDEPRGSLSRDAILQNAPKRKDGYFAVPKVLK